MELLSAELNVAYLMEVHTLVSGLCSLKHACDFTAGVPRYSNYMYAKTLLSRSFP